MTTLVTGATGFVGAAVARALCAKGVAVRALVRPGSDRRNLDGLDVELVEGDLLDPPSLTRATQGCDALYHVAADYRLWTRDPAAMLRANVDGSVAILRAGAEAGMARMVYTSSVAVLKAGTDGTPADETTPTTEADMIGIYKLSKYRAEEAVKRLITEDSLPIVIVNPSTPIGPRDIKPTPTGRMIVEAASGRMPAFVDTGLNVVHVEDVADGHLAAMERGVLGERYILGGEDMELGAILAEVAALTGRKAPTVKLPIGPLMPLAYGAEAVAKLLKSDKEPFVTVDGLRMARKKMFFSWANAAQALDYKPRPAQQALADAVAWFREKGYLT
ncbi:MAG: hopanoid-associated sugar epimerase [Rhodospirillaceae bacterium]